MIISESVMALLGSFSYAGVALVVALAGYVIPVPEEVVLLLAGYVAGSGFNNVWVVLAVSFVSLLASDYLAYLLLRAGTTLIRFLGAGRISGQRVAGFERRMQAHRGKTMFTLRFAPGLRFLNILLAASLRVPPRVFLWYDGLALLFYTPLYIFLGYYFHGRIAAVITGVTAARHLFSLVGLGLGGGLIVFLIRRFTNPPE